jgi:hypothetical protein
MKIIIVENSRPLTIEHYNDVANAPLSASLNSGYALAVAREAGWETGYLDFSSCREDGKTIAAAIGVEDADIILFHWVYSWGNEAAVREVLDLMRSDRCGLIGAFGLFPTLTCNKLSRYAPQLDFIIVGEFEKTLEELLHNYKKSHKLITVPGIYRKDEPFTARAVISDLSQLPVPDDVGANCAYPTMNIAASRGCFGDCGFCFINSFYGCTTRRERIIDSFAREFEQRLKRRDIKRLYFIDPTFIGYGRNQKERVRTISEIVRNSGIPFGFETRVDTVDADLVSVLAKNGATSLFLGIESGCDAVLQRVNKRIRKKDIYRAVHHIKESGIQLTVGFIMFEADTTRAELLENYAFLEELGLLSEHDTTMNMLYHSQIVLAGSKAWTRFESEGRLLVDEKLPFEANYLFKHDNVARICAAMKKLAAEYFLRINSLGMPRYHPEISCAVKSSAVNLLLKDAFRAFVTYADTCNQHQFSRLEETFVADLRGCL